MAQPPLLRDVIDIKESISTSDFVLTLAEAVTPEGAEHALRDYVVTDRLLTNFDEALGLIKSAVDGRTSKASYLHGSFGSGKSHFMAVLYALLSGNAAARGRAEFGPTLARHEWLRSDGRKFLLVPYHMMSARSLEQKVLGGYVSHIRKLHPVAPIPPVYRTEALFTDIRALRERVGDAQLVEWLGGAGGEEDEWGEAFGWTPALLDTALNAEEDHDAGAALNLVHPSTPQELRAKLVNDAGGTLFPGFAQGAAEDAHRFVSLDRGLTVIAEHAKALGYDGMILFLDELVLWLATLIHDPKLAAIEAGKITNFVEGGDARRAIPVVSFIARQRDLRELVGEEVSGAAEAAIQDTLNLASGRFDKITLEDRNLPQIAHARLLRPKDADAAAKIDAAFAETKREGGSQVWDTLLGSEKGMTGADEETFRLTYPFSPAFMDTLVHISSALQQSRTGLKLMGELLAAHREDLRLGQLIPLGELYPVIARGGDKPFVDNLKPVFDAADRLYRRKFRPYLLSARDVTDEDVEAYLRRPAGVEPAIAAKCRQFLGDNRLACTLLLSALAPSVPALADLTFRRLGALNYGSVTSPFPGGEVATIQSKVREWAAQIPEIKETGPEANRVVRLELTGVDVDSVIANAAVNDTPGNRSALMRRLLVEELGVVTTDGRRDPDELRFVWRGSSRTAEVVFGNLSDPDDLPDHDLLPTGEDAWRIIVDLPYDEGNYTPIDDVNRLRDLARRQAGRPQGRSRTFAWVPAHMSAQRWRELKRLVIIDRALADENRFVTQYAAHLNPDARAQARSLLGSQRETLIRQLKGAIKQAYGLARKEASDVVLGFDEHLVPLPETAPLTLSIGQPMHDAVRHLAGQLLAHQFPAHPNLDPDEEGLSVKTADARTIFTHIRTAAEARDGRVEVPSRDRKVMRRVAEPLGLGQQKEAYFVLSPRWADHIKKQARTHGATGDLTVITLTDWIDQPEAMGLEPFVANLVVASFAEMDDRVWVRGGTPLDPQPELSQIKERDALRSQELPTEEDWDAARERYEKIFGAKPPALRRGRMVNRFARQIIDDARRFSEPAAELVTRLEEHQEFLHLDGAGESGRLELAHRSRALLQQLIDSAERASGPKRAIEALAGFRLGSVHAERYGTSITQAQAIAGALAATSWTTLKLATNAGPKGQALLESLRNVARADQLTDDLAAALRDTTEKVLELVRQSQGDGSGPVTTPSPGGSGEVDLNTPTGDPEVPTTVPPSPAGGAGSVRRSGTRRTTAGRAVADLQQDLAALTARNPDLAIEVSWKVVDS
ncbi:MAG: phage resistance protein [Streptosporangiales bacterium]|nr:phage resistance protein [Streptosporangiales bacterium]